MHARTGIRRTAKICVASVLVLGGCGGYEEIGPHAYEYATALYAICNQRDEARLEQFSAALEDAQEAGDVTDVEAGEIGVIVSLARAGEWEDATKESRQLLLDQVDGAP